MFSLGKLTKKIISVIKLYVSSVQNYNAKGKEPVLLIVLKGDFQP